jgi:hypothetical protein
MERIDGELWSYIISKAAVDGQRPSEFVEAIATLEKVRYTARYKSSCPDFEIFTAVTHDDLAELQARIDEDYWVAGLRTQTFTLVSASPLGVPKRHSPDWNALVFAHAKGADAETVLERIDDVFRPRAQADPNRLHFSYAAAVVDGSYDLLVDLGTDDYDELVRTVRRDLYPIEGFGRPCPGWAYLPGNAQRPNPED